MQQLLITRNIVLDAASRRYALTLMADVVPDQRWGVSAGAPPDVTVDLKNGWLPDPDLWDVNSIGDFTRDDLDYSIVILTSNDPDMASGVTTVETVARLINQALARADAPERDPAAGTSPEPLQHLLCMQRRFAHEPRHLPIVGRARRGRTAAHPCQVHRRPGRARQAPDQRSATPD